SVTTKSVNASCRAVLSHPKRSCSGLTNSVQPYCRLETATMPTMPAASCTQRLLRTSVPPEKHDDSPEGGPVTVKSLAASASVRRRFRPPGDTYLIAAVFSGPPAVERTRELGGASNPPRRDAAADATSRTKTPPNAGRTKPLTS